MDIVIDAQKRIFHDKLSNNQLECNKSCVCSRCHTSLPWSTPINIVTCPRCKSIVNLDVQPFLITNNWEEN